MYWPEAQRGMRMRKPLLGALVILGAACAAMAQDAPVAADAAKNLGNAAAPFSDTSAARVNLFSTSSDLDSSNLAMANPSATASLAAPAAPAAPAPKPRFVFGDRDDYRWQLGLG